jgi:hypothetical protein
MRSPTADKAMICWTLGITGAPQRGRQRACRSISLVL